MIRYPNIIGKTDAQKLEQMKSYLHQLADELNFQLEKVGGAQNGNLQTARATAAAIAKPVKDDSAISNFNEIKALIIKSADIVDAYSESIKKSLEGEYVAVSDFGTYTEETLAELDISSDRISSALDKYEKIDGEMGELEERMRSEIEQTADSIKLEVTGGEPGKTASIKLSVGEGDDKKEYTGTIDMTGLVTFTNLATADGTTVINGSNITTGQIIADLIKAGVIKSKDGNTFFDLENGTIVSQTSNRKLVFHGSELTMRIDNRTRLRIGAGSGDEMSHIMFVNENGENALLIATATDPTTGKDYIAISMPNADGSGFVSEWVCWKTFAGVPMITSHDAKFSVDLTSDVKNALPIANGGTGAADRVNAMKNLSSIGMNPIASASEDTVSNWVAKGNGYAYFNKFVLNNQPTQRGFLVNKVQDSTIHQEWHTIEQHSKVYVRAGQGSAWVGGSVWEHGQTDFVTATGTSGVWTYWKFNSGLCIAMGTPTVTWGTQTQMIAGQYRSTASLDLTGIFTAVMGGTCSNVHRYVNCFVNPSGNATPELWATTAAVAGNSLYSNKPTVVLFGKWK